MISRFLPCAFLFLALAACAGGDQHATNSPTLTVSPTESSLPSSTAHPGGGFVVSSRLLDNRLLLLENFGSTGPEELPLPESCSFSAGFQISPDGRYVAVGCPPHIYILDVDTRVYIASVEVESLRGFAWSPDSKMLAFGQATDHLDNDSPTDGYIVSPLGDPIDKISYETAFWIGPWNPDGRLFASLGNLKCPDGKENVCIGSRLTDLRTHTWVSFMQPGEILAWSRDGALGATTFRDPDKALSAFSYAEAMSVIDVPAEDGAFVDDTDQRVVLSGSNVTPLGWSDNQFLIAATCERAGTECKYWRLGTNDKERPLKLGDYFLHGIFSGAALRDTDLYLRIQRLEVPDHFDLWRFDTETGAQELVAYDIDAGPFAVWTPRD